MHQQIVALVRAFDKVSALNRADEVFRKLIGKQRSYDGYSLGDAYKYDSEKGKSVLQTVFGKQTIEFNDHLAAVRNVLRAGLLKPDDELMEDHSFRYHCLQIGETDGSAITVFDNDAEGVQDKAHLKNIIEDWPGLVESGQHKKSAHPLWVVTADGHY